MATLLWAAVNVGIAFSARNNPELLWIVSLMIGLIIHCYGIHRKLWRYDMEMIDVLQGEINLEETEQKR
jgi:hypothetical protein